MMPAGGGGQKLLLERGKKAIAEAWNLHPQADEALLQGSGIWMVCGVHFFQTKGGLDLSKFDH